jgi:2-polyprenyl-6-methoxyphenol hydroxylase-like FAD-dependent oxidoreductase
MNPLKDKLPILIVGGGIGGMATALALSKTGWKVEVFERAAEMKEIGAGIQLGPNAFHVFDQLGITSEVSALASFPENLIARDSINGDLITVIPTGSVIKARYGHPYGLIHRADLHTILVNACKRANGIKLHVGTKMVNFDDTGDGVVITMENGDQHRGAALVGADGLWSTVRSKLINDGKPRVSGHIAYRAVLPIEDVPAANSKNEMTLWSGPKHHLVHYPLRGGKLFNLVAVFHSSRYEEGWDAPGDPKELYERFKGTRPEVLGMLEKIDAWRMWVLCDREPIAEWSKGRVTLLGDAAHPMLQYLAQGACMAMEDGVCLAGALAKNISIEEAFVDYQRTRYLRTARVQLTARLYGEVFHASGASRDLRNNFLKQRSPEQSLESMSWLYDTSASELRGIGKSV